MVRFALDIDGVVANYRQGIHDLTQQLGIGPLAQPVGLEPEALDALMEERQAEVQKTLSDWIGGHVEEFWGGLGLLASPDDFRAIRTAVAQGHALFWVSSRPSLGRMEGVVADVTLNWLQQHHFPANEFNVILTPKKSGVLREQHIQYHLDDLVPHATEVAFNSEATVYLLKQPWNRRMIFRNPDEPEYTASAGAFGIPEVDSIAEYITLITGGK